MTTDVLVVDSLHKSYKVHFYSKRKHAVRGISLRIQQGEVFGFLGPNGAGKTTTIRMLMGLIKPDKGTVTILGNTVPSRMARSVVGFLPEAPYFYEYLSVTELLDLTGRIFGLSKKQRKKKNDELIELVGLGHARNTALRKYSKGMMQRAGIAQSLVNDPKLIVFDEPMSGLDPVGRREVREIIHRLRQENRTVFFSSHILNDVETVSDRVAIVVNGKIHDLGTPSDLVSDKLLGTRVTISAPTQLAEKLRPPSVPAEKSIQTAITDSSTSFVLPPETDISAYLSKCLNEGAHLVDVTPLRQTLEDLFVERAKLSKEGAR